MKIRSVATSALGLWVTSLVLAGCGGSPTQTVEVKISIAENTPALKRATISVDTTKSGARLELKGGQPACASILPHVSCRFSQDGGRLTIEAESPQGFSGPADVAVCRMIPDTADLASAKIASRLRVTVLDARGGDGQPVAVASGPRARARDSSREGAAAASDTLDVDGDSAQAAAPNQRADRQSAGAAGGGVQGAPDSASGQGMVVTRDDLQQREQRRAEEQLKQRQADVVARGGSGVGTAAAPPAGGAMATDDSASGDDGFGDTNDASDNDPAATAYVVSFQLGQTAGPLGALQFDVDYNAGNGGWLGAGARADCRWLVAAALHACNDKRGGSLTCAIVDTNGFSGPTPLMECTFRTRNSLAAGDFSVRVTDASDPDLKPADARVSVAGVYAR
jgi:hypothetical protein